MKDLTPGMKQLWTPTLGEIIEQLANSYGQDDPFYNRFISYKPISKLISYFASRKRTKAIIGANKCIDGSTMIYDPVAEVFRQVQDTKSKFSVLAWNGESLVPAAAFAPFVKAEDEMYEVIFQNGQRLLCTLEHRIMTGRKVYSSLQRLQVGDYVFQPASSLDTVQRVQNEDDLRLNQITVKLINFHQTIITSIKPVGKRKVWDFEVPEYHNYFAGGVINHNSTKTTAGIWEDIMIYTGMVPPSIQGIYPHKLPLDRKRLVRIVVQNYSKHWPETIKPLLVGQGEGMLPKLWANWDEDTHMFIGPDGSMLSIMSIDPRERVDPRILRGPLVDWTHFDETTLQVAYEESITRAASLKEGPAGVGLTFCPQDGYDWTYQELFKTTHDSATDEPWPEDKTHPDIFCVYGLSMEDNPSISVEKRTAVKSRLKPHQLAYRYYGKYSLRGDNAYFNIELLEKWRKLDIFHDYGMPYEVIEKDVDVETGVFKGELKKLQRYDERYDHVWFVWTLPQNRHKYICSSDSAEGNINSDYCVATIWDATDRHKAFQVAQFRKRLIKPGDFTIQTLCMCNIYGNCLFVPECNNTSGGAVIDRARNYENIYTRITEGKIEELPTEKLGWHTNAFTKPAMLEDAYNVLNEYAQKEHCPFRSKFTIDEFLEYQEKTERDAFNVTRTKWGTKAGGHDDCVTETCITLRIIKHEFFLLTKARINDIVGGQEVDELSELERKAQNVTKRDFKKVPKLISLYRQTHGIQRRKRA